MSLERFPSAFEKVLYDEQVPRIVEELQRRSFSFSTAIVSGFVNLNKLVTDSQTTGDLVYFSGTEWQRLPRGSEGSILSANSGTLSYKTLTASGGVVLNDSLGHLALSLSSNLNSLASLDSTPGYLVQTGSSTFAKRTLIAGTGLNITNTTGGGNPSFSLADTSISAGSYGSTTKIPSFIVDGQGRLTAATELTVSVSGAGGVEGAGSVKQIPYFTGTNTVTGSPAMVYDPVTGVQINTDVVIGGDLVVNGDMTTITSTSISLNDTLVRLASGNPFDTADIGFFAEYNYSATPRYTGLFRDASDGWYKFFTGSYTQPSTTINTSASGYTKANLLLGDLDSQTTNTTKLFASGNTGVQNNDDLVPFAVGGIDGVAPSFEVNVSSSNVFVQAYNRNSFGYAPLFLDVDSFYIRPGGSTKFSLDSAGRATFAGTGSSAGIEVGGDVLWYRDSANVWRTPDSVIIDTAAYVPTAALGSSNTLVANTDFVTKTVTGIIKSAPNVLLVSGYTPSASGIDAVKWIVPFHPSTGEALTYNVKRIDLRVETPGTVSARINIMKSSGNGAFSGTKLLTNEMWVGNATRETSGITPHFAVSTVTSGDKLATFFENIGTGVQEFTVQVQLLQQ